MKYLGSKRKMTKGHVERSPSFELCQQFPRRVLLFRRYWFRFGKDVRSIAPWFQTSRTMGYLTTAMTDTFTDSEHHVFPAESLRASKQLSMVAGGPSVFFTTEDFNTKCFPDSTRLCIFLATANILRDYDSAPSDVEAEGDLDATQMCMYFATAAASRQALSKIFSRNLGRGRIQSDHCNWGNITLRNQESQQLVKKLRRAKILRSRERSWLRYRTRSPCSAQ